MMVTRRARRWWNVRKAGHAGTLDPLASGVLPIALGRATTLIPFLMRQSKTYRFTIQWGEATTTDDREGEVCACHDKRPSQEEILGVLDHFRGAIVQTPPIFSAVKIGGKPAYHRASRGESVAVPQRVVQIDALELLAWDRESATLEVTCGSGTYVRALGRDMAQALGTVGHLSALCRTRVGPFRLDDAIALDFCEEMVHKREGVMFPPEAVLDDIPVMNVSEEACKKLWQGQPIVATMDEACAWGEGRDLACFYAGRLVALAVWREGIVCPTRCFPEACGGKERKDDVG